MRPLHGYRLPLCLNPVSYVRVSFAAGERCELEWRWAVVMCSVLLSLPPGRAHEYSEAPRVHCVLLYKEMPHIRLLTAIPSIGAVAR